MNKGWLADERGLARTNQRRSSALVRIRVLIPVGVVLVALSCARSADAPEPAWTKAHLKSPMTKDETRAFIRKLAQYVFEHHLKRNENSEQRGMVYEYLDTARIGQADQFVQGEALDTMHDGAWFAVAMVNAYRATGDAFYKSFLTKWILPFYLKMLNHSDTLFSTKAAHAREGAPIFNREHMLQEGEKGFVPYWWDDGGSVSLERRRSKRQLPEFPAFDRFIASNEPNPEFRLRGYSLGSSNHMAQDLGLMVQQAWLLLRESADANDRKLTAELVDAAKNLHQCRLNHHGHIPMVCAPLALATGDAEELKRIPDQSGKDTWTPNNHYTRAMYDFKPGQRYPFPGFADDQQYRYEFGLAKHGTLPKAIAFKTIYDAYTEPMMYRYYSDDAPVPSGINRFDLHPYYAKDGKLEDYRSDRKGPGGRPRPIGSRFGPQNMVCSGWALQALKEWPGIWEEQPTKEYESDLRATLVDPPRTGGIMDWIYKNPTIHIPGKIGFRPFFGRKEMALIGDRNRNQSQFAIDVFSGPDARASGVHIVLKNDGSVTAKNDNGEELAISNESVGSEFSVWLPYTIGKDQKPWANGIEHGRYSIRVAGKTFVVYVALMEAQLFYWLRNELAGGLRTWEAIFNEYGYIPTGIGTNAEWDRFSDSGGYAHLISAAAQWLLYLDGKKDWEAQRLPRLAP